MPTDQCVERGPARRWVTAFLWLLLLPFALWAVPRLSGRTPTWHWVSLVAFTPYAAVASAVPLGLALGLRRPPVILAALATTTAFAAVVLPRWLPDGNPPAHGERLRVLGTNLAVGQADTAAVMRLVREARPDVFMVQELTPQAAGRLNEAGLRTLVPYAVDRSSVDPQGSGIYARHPVRHFSVHRLPGTDHRSVFAVLRLP
ncbi:endonuclease/exonuclease/phosphatase family protein [Actinomadura viridis]|uniref:endonuclease/exonuclease/phosphatase family protein n=1 Tax=Actinomadura viridis TaxID=58110 RepID=UPI0036A3630C